MDESRILNFVALGQATYDRLFRRYAGSIPVPLLRALAGRESGLNPGATTGSYRGLFQVGPQVREGYNERHGTTYAPEDLYDPEVNARIAADTFRRIIRSYRA
ncbi:MAG: transglycosylase SLT domain-containing protein, partial [Candidatus Methylomirabilales bacterium]